MWSNGRMCTDSKFFTSLGNPGRGGRESEIRKEGEVDNEREKDGRKIR